MFKQKKDRGPRQTNYLWVLAGGYLIYLGGDLIYSVIKGTTTVAALSIIAAVVFIGVGGWVCLREWRIYRYGSKEEQEAWAQEQAETADVSYEETEPEDEAEELLTPPLDDDEEDEQ